MGNQLVQPVVAGIQAQKVVANAKHFAMNSGQSSGCFMLFCFTVLNGRYCFSIAAASLLYPCCIPYSEITLSYTPGYPKDDSQLLAHLYNASSSTSSDPRASAR